MKLGALLKPRVHAIKTYPRLAPVSTAFDIEVVDNGLRGPGRAYVIRGEEVEWKPAIDVTSVILRLQGVLLLVLLVLLRRRRG